ncbi:MAG: hypothetical protein C4293_09890 [Nitrospiraceae bacterium]
MASPLEPVDLVCLVFVWFALSIRLLRSIDPLGSFSVRPLPGEVARQGAGLPSQCERRFP